MNTQVINEIEKEILKKKISRYRLGKDSGITPHTNIYRMLDGEVAHVPESWQSVFDVLGIELMAIPQDKITAVKKLLKS